MELTQEDLRSLRGFEVLDPARRKKLLDLAAELLAEQRAEQAGS